MVPASTWIARLYTERDSKIGIWQGCGHLKKLGGSSFFEGSRPEFEPGLAGAGSGVPEDASSLGWGAGGTQIQWLPDAAPGVLKTASVLGWGVARTDFSITSGI
jgi:hypothetical protein